MWINFDLKSPQSTPLFMEREEVDEELRWWTMWERLLTINEEWLWFSAMKPERWHRELVVMVGEMATISEDCWSLEERRTMAETGDGGWQLWWGRKRLSIAIAIEAMNAKYRSVVKLQQTPLRFFFFKFILQCWRWMMALLLLLIDESFLFSFLNHSFICFFLISSLPFFSLVFIIFFLLLIFFSN